MKPVSNLEHVIFVFKFILNLFPDMCIFRGFTIIYNASIVVASTTWDVHPHQFILNNEISSTGLRHESDTASPEWTDNIQRRLQWHRPPHAPPCISPPTQPPSSGMSDVRQYGRHDGNTHDDARRRDTVLVGTRGGGGARVAFVTWTIRGLAPVNHPDWSLAGRTVYRRWLIAVAFELLMQEPRSGQNMEANRIRIYFFFIFQKSFPFWYIYLEKSYF